MLRRLYHLSSATPKRGSDVMLTLGHLTRWVGGWVCVVGYGWCAQASKRTRGLVLDSSSAKRPGACDAEVVRPRADVSPIAISAERDAALIPAYPARCRRA